jgi:hypothetical protein
MRAARRQYSAKHRKASATVRAVAATAGTAAGLAVIGTALSAAPAHALIMPVDRPVPAAVVAEKAGPQTAVIEPGGSLYAEAELYCGTGADWLGIWHATGGIPDPNEVLAGQRVTIACNDDGPGYSPPARVVSYVRQAAPQQAGAPVQQLAVQESTQVSSSSYSGFQRCVIARESGGNSQVMNSSGHYGLYQFSEPTWEAYGGSAADFGHASVAEQNQVFSNAMARDGDSNWSAYDGC